VPGHDQWDDGALNWSGLDETEVANAFKELRIQTEGGEGDGGCIARRRFEQRRVRALRPRKPIMR
jgi:hypothetical protein